MNRELLTFYGLKCNPFASDLPVDSLGRSEVEEVPEGFSYGANTIRDGVSLTPKRALRALALASEIMQLESLHGYLRFPGPLPVAPSRSTTSSAPRSPSGSWCGPGRPHRSRRKRRCIRRRTAKPGMLRKPGRTSNRRTG